LKQARELAADARAVSRSGKDPIKERERTKREAAKEVHTLRSVADAAFEARKAELKGDGKAGRWFSQLELHVLPKLGGVPVEEIDQKDIRDCIAPIWHTKAETARKAMNRLHIVLQYGAAMGLDVDLQAVDKAKQLLGRTRHKEQNIPSVHWSAVPGFYASLDTGTPTELALCLLILTGARSGSIRHCSLEQVHGNVWTIPAEYMKSRKDQAKEFRVPLSLEAMRIIDLARPFERDGFLFPGARKGVISDATMSAYMKRLGMDERPHGFRSSLRTWIAETTQTRHEIAETVMAHTTGSSVERAYLRTDYLDERRIVMDAWADHVTQRGQHNLRLVQ